MRHAIAVAHQLALQVGADPVSIWNSKSSWKSAFRSQRIVARSFWDRASQFRDKTRSAAACASGGCSCRLRRLFADKHLHWLFVGAFAQAYAASDGEQVVDIAFAAVEVRLDYRATVGVCARTRFTRSGGAAYMRSLPYQYQKAVVCAPARRWKAQPFAEFGAISNPNCVSLQETLACRRSWRYGRKSPGRRPCFWRRLWC